VSNAQPPPVDHRPALVGRQQEPLGEVPTLVHPGPYLEQSEPGVARCVHSTVHSDLMQEATWCTSTGTSPGLRACRVNSFHDALGCGDVGELRLVLGGEPDADLVDQRAVVGPAAAQERVERQQHRRPVNQSAITPSCPLWSHAVSAVQSPSITPREVVRSPSLAGRRPVRVRPQPERFVRPATARTRGRSRRETPPSSTPGCRLARTPARRPARTASRTRIASRARWGPAPGDAGGGVLVPEEVRELAALLDAMDADDVSRG
jgi:hypothetical protein